MVREQESDDMTTTEPTTADRAGRIGSSDAAAILGIDPWRSRVEAWMDITGTSEAKPETLPMRVGTYMEPLLRELYHEETQRLVVPGKYHTHSFHPWMSAHTDAEVLWPYRIVELKHTASFSAYGDGTDAVPDRVIAQVQHALEVTNCGVADVLALTGGNRAVRLYEIPKDPELVAAILEAEEQFWVEHVQKDIPPEPASSADVRRLWPRHDPGKIKRLDQPGTEILLEWMHARNRAAETEHRLEIAKFRMEEWLADAESAVDGTHELVTFRANKDSERIDVARLRKEAPEIASKFSKVQPGARVLRLTKHAEALP